MLEQNFINFWSFWHILLKSAFLRLLLQFANIIFCSHFDHIWFITVIFYSIHIFIYALFIFCWKVHLTDCWRCLLISSFHILIIFHLFVVHFLFIFVLFLFIFVQILLKSAFLRLLVQFADIIFGDKRKKTRKWCHKEKTTIQLANILLKLFLVLEIFKTS